MVFGKMETRAAVLHGDAPVGDDHAAAEAGVVALDEGDAVALAVGGAKKNRAAGLGNAGGKVLRLDGIDPLGEFGEPLFVEQLLGRGPEVFGVSHVGVGVGKAELHRLDLEVQYVGAVGVVVGKVEVPQDAQGHQRRQALAVGGNLVQGAAAVVDGDRFDGECFVLGQIIRPHEPVFGDAGPLDRPGDVAFVERAAFAFRDCPQRAGVSGQPHQLAGLRRRAIEEEGALPVFAAAIGTGGAVPEVRGLRGDEIAVLRVVDGGLEEFGKGEPPVGFPELRPEIDGAGHRDRFPTQPRHAPLAGEGGGVEALRTAARTVPAVDLPAIPHQREGVAPETVGGGFDHRHARSGGDRGVGGGATATQHLEPGVGGDGDAGRHHVGGGDRFALRGVRKVVGEC